MSKVKDLTSSNFKEEIANGVTLVDFWAPWCGPCRMIAPVIDELAGDFDGKAKVCKVNTDEERELGIEYVIRSIPTFLIFKDGEVVDQIIGAGSKHLFIDRIKKVLGE